jgi:hypothetical protein
MIRRRTRIQRNALLAVESAGLSDGPKGSSEAERIAARYEGFSAIPAGAATSMATYVSTEQYMWGLHRVLDGITGGRAKGRTQGRAIGELADAGRKPSPAVALPSEMVLQTRCHEYSVFGGTAPR